MSGKALWSGRFDGDMDESTLKFTSSLDVDMALAFYDVMGSLAHVMMLKECNIIPADDADVIVEGLRLIVDELMNDEFEVNFELEDVHTNIEVRLTEIIGSAGGRLHTGRSRNDQVATDFRMYLRDAVLEVIDTINKLIKSLIDIAGQKTGTVMPGFTHTQHGQPVSVGHHLMAHAFKLSRDAERFMDAYDRLNMCPLGSAALAGTTYPIDRKRTSDLLGFSRPTENSMDSVSDRDFAIEILSAAAITGIHLSSIAEELIYWSSPEFKFIDIDDRYTTGSSIMPQKKNPDIAELTRGKTGSITGSLVNLLWIMKGLPLSYNRDMQEDKRPTMDALDTLNECTDLMQKMIFTMKFNEKRLLEATVDGFTNATDLADYLASRGMPFREAHEIVGSAVRYCIHEGTSLDKLTIGEMKGFSEIIEKDVFEILPVEKCIERRMSYGGTSPRAVEVQIFEALSALITREEFVKQEISLIEQCWEFLLDEDE